MVTFRQAQQSDLTRLVHMLADDPLGAQRENLSSPLPNSYLDAFLHINQDPNNELIVAEQAGHIVGMLQLTFIPYLTYQGSWRCLIEGVRIDTQYRGHGIGGQMFQWVIERAKAKNCRLIQLTSDKLRPDAIRFYQSLGFTASHEGMKLSLID